MSDPIIQDAADSAARAVASLEHGTECRVFNPLTRDPEFGGRPTQRCRDCSLLEWQHRDDNEPGGDRVPAREYALALDSQNACSTSGLLGDLARVVREHLWPEAQRLGRGTSFINAHPIVFLYTYQMLALTGHEAGDQYKAWQQHHATCERRARK